MGKKWIGIISSLMLVLAAVTGSVWPAWAEDSGKTTQGQGAESVETAGELEYAVLEESTGRQKVQMEYYQYNVCGSCHPEDDFYAIVTDMIRPLREEYPYEITVYNTFRSYDRQKFQKRLQELGLKEEETALPALIVGSSCLSGLDDIRAGIKNLLIDAANQSETENTADLENGMTAAADTQENPTADTGAEESREEGVENWKEQLRKTAVEDTEDESVLFYFSTVSCDDCNTVKELLARMTAEQEASSEKSSGSEKTSGAQAEMLSALKIHEFNIAEDDGVVVLQQLFEIYGVPSEEQQVPIVFFNGGYLSGAKAISDQLDRLWKQGTLTGFDLEALLASSGSTDEEKPLASLTSYLGLAVTGFINGINPCGASMLLMLLAAMAMAGRSVIRVGCAYLAGKFAAYCAMGLGLYQLFLMIDQNILLSVSRVLTWVFAAFFLVLAVLYLIDFINVRKKEYGKIRMQLPQALRKWNHRRIEEASKAKGVWLIPAAFLLGIVISAGEFFCTGQVYLAAILYLMKMQQEQQLQTAAAFLIYVAAMCIPSLLIVLVIEKTRNVIRMSNAAVTWLPVIKLVTAVVFFLFAVLMILQ